MSDETIIDDLAHTFGTGSGAEWGNAKNQKSKRSLAARQGRSTTIRAKSRKVSLPTIGFLKDERA